MLRGCNKLTCMKKEMKVGRKTHSGRLRVSAPLVGRKLSCGNIVMLGGRWRGMVVRVGDAYIVVRWSNGVAWTHWTWHWYRVLDWDFTQSVYHYEWRES